MKTTNRREFIKTTTTAAAGLMFTFPTLKTGFANKSANDTINVAVAGIRGKGFVPENN